MACRRHLDMPLSTGYNCHAPPSCRPPNATRIVAGKRNVAALSAVVISFFRYVCHAALPLSVLLLPCCMCHTSRHRCPCPLYVMNFNEYRQRDGPKVTAKRAAATATCHLPQTHTHTLPHTHTCLGVKHFRGQRTGQKQSAKQPNTGCL